MNIKSLQTAGFVSVPYPAELKVAVAEAQKLWDAFCDLPEEVKRSFPYSNNGAGAGYEDKRISGNSADWKENFDLSLSDLEWLKTNALEIGNETIISFVDAASKVSVLLSASFVEFAHDVEETFSVDGFEAEIAKGKDRCFIRFIHYFPGAELSQETAEAHTDQSGMTGHLFTNEEGLECLTQDMEWVPMPVSHGEMTIIPAMQLQLRSKGVLKATVHRVVATSRTQLKGRKAAVAFQQFPDTPKYDKDTMGRLQEAHKKDLGFNYRMSHDESKKLFK